jgi:hypothetical protein
MTTYLVAGTICKVADSRNPRDPWLQGMALKRSAQCVAVAFSMVPSDRRIS